MKYLVIIFGVIEFFGTMNSSSGRGGSISHIAHLGGLISGFLFIFYKRRKRPEEKKRVEDGFLKQIIKSSKIKKKKEEIDKRIEAKKIIDTLLDKIARHGMSSLTPKEKKRLEWARKNYYPDGEDTLH